ncbi:glycosyltransferase family 39 protein [Lactococcus petauri]|uniref:glycosyltransferase family 39 protein n=1 Tax=Lactococcus petauri TaxID=1940789 RepID=UPI0023EBE052|nr:glycosyltransferase family 39 protein [Lactococcus petauri]
MNLKRREKKEESNKNNSSIVKYFIIFVSFLTSIGLFSILLIQFLFSLNFYPSSTKKVPDIQMVNPLLVLFAFLLFVLLQYVLYRVIKNLNITTKILNRILLIYSSIFGIAISALFFCPPFSDVFFVINGFVVNNSMTMSYVEYYPNTLGLGLIFQGLFKIFGRDAWSLMYVFNTLSVLGIFYALPKITRLLHNEHAEKICIQFLFFAFPYFFMITFLYNDLISLVLVLFSLLLLIKFVKSDNKKISNAVFSGIFLGLAWIIRTNTIIFIIGIILYLILRIVRDRKFSLNHQLSIIPILVALTLQLGFQFTAPKMVPNYSSKYAQPSTSWVAMALADKDTMKGYRYRQPGMYNDFGIWTFDKYKETHPNASKIEYTEDVTGRNKIYKEFISSRVIYMAKHPIEAIKFFGTKEIASWGDPSLSGNYSINESYDKRKVLYEKLPLESIALTQSIQSISMPQFKDKQARFDSPISKFMVKTKTITNYIERPFLILMLLGSLIFIIRKRFKIDLDIFLLILIFLGGIVFHQFIWETQPRYFLPYVALLIPVSAISFSEILDRKMKK